MEPAGRKMEVFQEKVKDVLGDLGIAGETVSPSPARTIEELASLGVVKGYSTIVAVGSERIVNKVVTALINQKANQDVVLGIIPDNFQSVLAKKIGVTDVKSACQALKQRKLQTIDACFIEPNKYFLTKAVLESNRIFDSYLILDTLQAGFPCSRMTIRPGLKITIEDGSLQKQSLMQKFLGIFSKTQRKEDRDISTSIFVSKKAKIEVPNASISVKADDETIAKTPITIHNRPKALKIIVAREGIDNQL